MSKDWQKLDLLNAAFNAGRAAWATNATRMSNPYAPGKRRSEWWRGYDSALAETMQQNLKGIGKY